MRPRTLVPLLALAAALLAAAPAQANVASAARYVAARHDAHGCSYEPGSKPSIELTAWVALGLRAAGRSAAGSMTCLAFHVRAMGQWNQIELAILAAAASGRNPRNVGGVNLVARLRAFRHGGTYAGQTNATIFAVLALRAARAPVPVAVRRALLRAQRRDGSYGWVGGVPSDSNMTAAAIQALRAIRVAPTAAPVRRALAALARFRRSNAGYGLNRGDPADAQSTAWAIQALVSVGRAAPRARRYLLRLQRSNGAIPHDLASGANPVWSTAQALAALRGRPLPGAP
jgi:hypothetical protein